MEEDSNAPERIYRQHFTGDKVKLYIKMEENVPEPELTNRQDLSEYEVKLEVEIKMEGDTPEPYGVPFSREKGNGGIEVQNGSASNALKEALTLSQSTQESDKNDNDYEDSRRESSKNVILDHNYSMPVFTSNVENSPKTNAHGDDGSLDVDDTFKPEDKTSSVEYKVKLALFGKTNVEYKIKITRSDGDDFENPEFTYVPVRKRELKDHEENEKDLQTESDVYIYGCDVCAKPFSTPAFLARHMETSHGSIESGECRVCGKLFFTDISLARHMETSHGSIGTGPPIVNARGRYAPGNWFTTRKPVHTWDKFFYIFKCDYCEKKFSTKGRLVMHTRIHTRKNYFVCDQCGKACAHRGEKSVVCDQCGKAFPQAHNPKQHGRIKSGEKPFARKKAFSQARKHIQHGRIKSGKKRFACDFCEKTCTGRGNLAMHTRIHTRDKLNSQSKIPQKT